VKRVLLGVLHVPKMLNQETSLVTIHVLIHITTRQTNFVIQLWRANLTNTNTKTRATLVKIYAGRVNNQERSDHLISRELTQQRLNVLPVLQMLTKFLITQMPGHQKLVYVTHINHQLLVLQKEKLLNLDQVPPLCPLHAIYVLQVVLDAQMINQSVSTHVTKVKLMVWIVSITTRLISFVTRNRTAELIKYNISSKINASTVQVCRLAAILLLIQPQ
jgi:hypothetical protein